jgi:glycosyltransferase involved in cell wall biosynthesis
MKHLIYICTKNREEDVFKFLHSVALNISNYELIIVDSTGPINRFTEFQNQIAKQFPTMKITHIFHQGRLPSARNSGIKLGIKGDLAHFFDDDVTIPSDYFEKIEEFLKMHPEIHGGGPRIKGSYLPEVKSGKGLRRNILKKFQNLRLRFRKYGKVDASCKNHWVPDSDGVEQIVDWIPGCSMFFKPEVFNSFQFNPKLEEGFQGYALGEDMEFTYRVSKKFRLMACDLTTIEHHLAPSPRGELEFMAGCSGALCAHMHRLFPKDFPTLTIYLGKFFEFFLKVVYLRQKRIRTFFKMYASFHREYKRESSEKNWYGTQAG